VTEDDLAMECAADVAEGHALIDVEHAREICAGIGHSGESAGARWRDQCVFGIATAFAPLDSAFALATCEESGQWRPFCRHDVNGERATVDPIAAASYCSALPLSQQDACWHGIGKYIARVDVRRALTVCEGVPLANDFRGQCIHGAGWAAAEAEGTGAVAWCEPLGPMRDSCVLGVAYHTKRFEPEIAVALCGRASDRDERARCLAFVGRGAAAPR
jgi:hypothetical protein